MKIKSIGMVKTIAISALLLTACDGSSDDDTSSPPPVGGGDDNGTSIHSEFWNEGPDPSMAGDELHTFELSGIVGYNQAAAGVEVCVDTNRDFTCDEDGPTTITAENGSYTLTVEAPYEVPEFFILATLPASEVQQGFSGSESMLDGEDIILKARAYYGGDINPLTTLEAKQYDDSLSYLQQVERYSHSRSLISNLYQLPRGLGQTQIFTDSGLNEPIEDLWETLNTEALSAYNEAKEYTSTRFQALRLAVNKYEPELIADAAKWLGVLASEHSLTEAQRLRAESGFLTEGQRVWLSVYTDRGDLLNELTDSLVEFRDNENSFQVEEGILSEDVAYEREMCWNEDESSWLESEPGLESFTTPTQIDDNTYSMEKIASGQEWLVHISALNDTSDFYSNALSGWDNKLDLSVAQVDGALVRARFERPDELCVYYSNVRSSRESMAFTEMSGDDVVALTTPSTFNSGSYEVNENLQRITLTNSDNEFDYRVLELDDRQLLMRFTVQDSLIGSLPTVWTWHEGQVDRVDFYIADRLNAFAAASSDFVLDDQAATDLLIQLEALAQ